MSTKTFSQIRLEQAINLIIDDDTPIREISIRCPYCGDSIKNPNSTHLGIKGSVTLRFIIVSNVMLRALFRQGFWRIWISIKQL